MFIRAYLRASTEDQDALRAKQSLERFCTEQGYKIAAFYVENISGTKLVRPELFRLLADCHRGDILLTEKVDRLSRLGAEDWERLKAQIKEHGVRVVALDLPTSHQMMTHDANEFSGRMLDAINGMMLDMLAAIARKDYDDRRRITADGIAKAKANGVYKGRPEDVARNEAIMKLLRAGQSWNDIQATLKPKPSRHTISKLAKRLKEGMVGVGG